jgi:hypothetical protein
VKGRGLARRKPRRAGATLLLWLLVAAALIAVALRYL